MNKQNFEYYPPRQIEYIAGDYNKICEVDELVIDQMLVYQEKNKEVPKQLVRQHQQNLSMLRELDEERNYSIPFWHNIYRLHYAQTYPGIIHKSIAKQRKQALKITPKGE